MPEIAGRFTTDINAYSGTLRRSFFCRNRPAQVRQTQTRKASGRRFWKSCKAYPPGMTAKNKAVRCKAPARLCDAFCVPDVKLYQTDLLRQSGRISRSVALRCSKYVKAPGATNRRGCFNSMTRYARYSSIVSANSSLPSRTSNLSINFWQNYCSWQGGF